MDGHVTPSVLQRVSRLPAMGLEGGRALFLCSLLVAATSCQRGVEARKGVVQRAATAPIVFVQGSYSAPQTSQTTVTVTFTQAQTAGNLNVAFVGWNNTSAQVSSVTDSQGNVYRAATSPTKKGGLGSQVIYYARNIAAAGNGTNAVTVTFTGAVKAADVRVLEYAGIDTVNPLDNAVGASGNSSTSSSGPLATTSANELLVAGNLAANSTSGPGTGFTARLLTSPGGDIAEDRVAASAGAYTATAPLSKSGAWIMQVAAFKAPSTPDSDPPTAPTNLAAAAVSGSQIDLSWTASTDDTGVTSYLIERCTGTGCASFSQIAATASTSYSDGALSASTSYGYRVRAADAAGNLSAYSSSASATTPEGAPAAPPAFVQVNAAVPQSPQSSVTVPYTAAQTSGDLNVVVVGWNDSQNQVSSVSDVSGNAYALAVGPTVVAGALSQSIYFARNIAAAAAGANAVTVTFTGAATYPDVRIVEYSGIDANSPLDVAAAGQGTSTSSDSGAVTTTHAYDLLVGANIVQTSTTGPGAGFTQRVLTNPDGDIVEDRVVTASGSYGATAPLGSAGSWIMQMVAFKAMGTPPASDTAPPTVAITAPAAGATVSGTIAVSVSASDALSVVGGVELLVDGLSVGAPVTSTPYAFSLDTSMWSNGAHSLGAYAWDSAGNLGYAAPLTVNFSNTNPGNPAQQGLWSGTVPLPIVSVHQALLPGGKVIMSDAQSFGLDAGVWDPVTNTFAPVPAPVNIFCSAEEVMADGRIFDVGGHANAAHVGLTAANVFDPVAQSWTVLPDMSYPRWYPTATALPDGSMLVVSGETSCDGCYETIAEVYSPVSNSWTRLTSAPFSFPYYPHVFVMPDGRALVSSTAEAPIVSQALNLGTLKWTAVGGPAVDGGSAVMYLPAKILKTGTSVDPDTSVRPSARTAYVLDMTQASPAWRQVPSMAAARTYHTATVLPDGNVLVTGGGPTTAATDTANAILAAEMWSPATETWTTLASMNAPRLYHSEALLLPDGRVAVSGGGRFDDATLPTDQFSAEFFSPPYLFRGARPVITAAPSTLQRAQTFTIQTPDASRIAQVSLVRYGAVTHAINMGQRFLPLTFVAGSGSLTVTAPSDANLAPPGYYMLFLVDTNGVPSVAASVHF